MERDEKIEGNGPHFQILAPLEGKVRAGIDPEV